VLHIEVDGSYGEGGGQLVRTAVALAALTGSALRLAGVRAKRAKPGLAPQHLAAVRAVAALCRARCEGLELGSTAFSFEPHARPAGGELRVDVGTAGSVTLVLQALLPILFAARNPSRVAVTGGTDVRQAPSWDYFRRVLLPLLGRMGLRASASCARRGYYPRGGGEVALEVEPGEPQALAFEKRFKPWQVSGEAHVANLPLTIAERMRAAALAADIAAGATLDRHAADQVLVYLALAGGDSRFLVRAVSSHARTAIWLIEKFLPARFEVEERAGLARVSATRARR
jgi:RNA 3'-phosphate cyclase